ncbi:MAG: hypothetical protein HY288_15625 [Planctomycetia bacterium]|nr:hypothetical protein [Planctomycetia bacterium]
MDTFMDILPKPANGTADGCASTIAPIDPADRIMRRGRAALMLILEAFENARDLQRDKWDFAVEIQTLRKAGLTYSDFRWLICKGYAEHAREITLPGHEGRAFYPNRGLTLYKRSCFVLSEAGLPFFAAACHRPRVAYDEQSSNQSANLSVPAARPAQVPKWDCDRQELRLGACIIKQFKVPAANQEMILAVFEEEKWPPRIDDPLPPQPESDPKRRLHDTINSLNRKQKNPLVHFLGDGSGTGVRWELSIRREELAHASVNGNGTY